MKFSLHHFILFYFILEFILSLVSVSIGIILKFKPTETDYISY